MKTKAGEDDRIRRNLVEAALFVSDKPLNLSDLSRIAGINSLGFVKDLLERLQQEYKDRGMEIVNTPEGWIMQVRQDFMERVSGLAPYSDIPEGCKRTLALIVYKEPVRQSEVIKMQGNKVYAYIKLLERKGLIKSEPFGRTKMLKLTKEFERYFGAEKEKIKDIIAKEFQQS